MAGIPFDVVDVFAAGPFAGNPLAVVRDGDGLTAAQMQAIAAEFALSETVFTLPPRGRADYRVRIFTPVRELPFAGHPSIGAAWVLARDGDIARGDRTQECGAGLLPVTVDRGGARIAGGPPTVGRRLEAEPLLAAVGLQDVAVGPAPAGVAGAGNEFAVVVVGPPDVGRAVPDPAAIRSVTRGTTGLIVASADEAVDRVHMRVFAPNVGVEEDPATGSAAVALGVFLADRGLIVEDGTDRFVVSQGGEIGRPSRLFVSVASVGGRAVSTSVFGEVHAVARGVLTALPPP